MEMHVVFNTYPVAFDCPGGGEIQLLKTKEALEKKGIEVLLYDPWNPRLSGAEVVHYFSVQSGAINFCSYVKRGKGLPLVISPIIWLGRDKQSYPLGEIKELFNLCDMILPNSVAELKQLSGFFEVPETKFHVTRNGIDPCFADPVTGEPFIERFGIKKPFLLNVANIEPRKNQINLIRAVKGMGIELILVGNVRDRPYFDECMEAGRGFTRHLGYLGHGSELLRSAYGLCDAFVLPSLLETPGLSALEAAAAGARIVVTGIGSAEEYFGRMATYVDPYDTDSIRRGIETELGVRRDEGLGKRVMENYTWERTALEVIGAYERVLGRSAGEPQSKVEN